MIKRITFIVLFCTLFFQISQARDYYLLATGISNYPGARNDLMLPVDDAIAIAELYKSCNNAHTTVLLNSKATKDNIVIEARSLFQKAEEDDVVVFFFSGHGAPDSFCAYDGYLKYSELRKVFASSKATSKIIFADACMSGGMRQGGSSGHKDFNSDIMLFLSCRDNEYSIERENMKNGVFTACLIRCLKGGADNNKDRIITAKELFDGVSKGVIELSQKKQHPVMWGNFDDNMIVISWK